MFADVISDFDLRVKEIELYLDAIVVIESGGIEIKGGMPLPQGVPPHDWSRMLKGAAYVILYNLVEAFVTRGFQEIFDAIDSDSLTCSQLNVQFRLEWLRQCTRKVDSYDGSPSVYMKLAHDIIEDLIAGKTAAFDVELLPFSGNLDADEIRKVFKRHGIAMSPQNASKGGGALRPVKTNRNALGHGTVSFVECGRYGSAADLIQVKDEVVAFMREILTDLETCVRNRAYR